MAPLELRARRLAARSSRTLPCLHSSSVAPSRPVQVMSPAVVRTSREEPAGRTTSISISGPEPKKSSRGRVVDRTSSSPSRKVTWVCFAAVTSAELSASRGRTVTVVSCRSSAWTWTAPWTSSMRARMGPGVSNVGMAAPSSGQGGSPPDRSAGVGGARCGGRAPSAPSR
jgi:hypothetical protein